MGLLFRKRLYLVVALRGCTLPENKPVRRKTEKTVPEDGVPSEVRKQARGAAKPPPARNGLLRAGENRSPQG